MSAADQIFINMCRDILENGTSTEDEKVRPKWEDGSSAYTIKKFGVVNRYDLSKEFPAMTLRPVAIKMATDEMLWIWQKKSNNIHELSSHIWDSWADEDGSIGKAYGYQMKEPGTGKLVLNAILNQRSQDVLTANNWNVCQYAVLVHMMARVCDMKAGELVHVIADAHIYDRHVPIVREMIERPTYPAPILWLNPEKNDFYDFTKDDVKLINYQHNEQIRNIPVAV